MRTAVSITSLHFGFLAIWWSSGRTLGSTHTLSAPQSRTQPIIKSAADMSLIDWALGPIEPESKASADRKSQRLGPERATESPAEEAKEFLADEAPQRDS